MTLAFLTNCIHHHQIPLADEFYKLLGKDYKYIAMESLPEWLIKGGYDANITRPYLIRAYSSEVDERTVNDLINSVDVLIVGSAPEMLIRDRIKSKKLTFRYCERIFKKKWYRQNPYNFAAICKTHTLLSNKHVFVLAASAFASNDFHVIHAYKNRVFKWGYFTKVEGFDLEASLDVSRRGRATILWCARFLSWKHPELPVQLVKKLKDEGYDFHLDMIGSGERFDDTVALAKALGVEDRVTFLGNMPNDDVLKQMRQHQIFLFTSDQNEGWGAVLNEAMSNGCTVVASDKIGAVPFLIQDGINGLIFKSESVESLYIQVKKILNDKLYSDSLARNAVISMRNEWSPKVAAERLLTLISHVEDKDMNMLFENGPCSVAHPVNL